MRDTRDTRTVKYIYGKERATKVEIFLAEKIFSHTRLSRKMSSNNLIFWHQSTYQRSSAPRKHRSLAIIF